MTSGGRGMLGERTADQMIAVATNPELNDAQITFVTQGEGAAVAEAFEQVKGNCAKAAATVDTVQGLWKEEVDDPEREPFGVMLAGDIGTATDRLMRKLAQCSGVCEVCPFEAYEDSVMPAGEVMKLDLTKQG